MDCNADADAAFASSMGTSGVGSYWNPIIAGAVALNAYINHRIAIRKCVRTLNACVGGCN